VYDIQSVHALLIVQ